jgi:hypothetical protein
VRRGAVVVSLSRVSRRRRHTWPGAPCLQQLGRSPPVSSGGKPKENARCNHARCAPNRRFPHSPSAAVRARSWPNFRYTENGRAASVWKPRGGFVNALPPARPPSSWICTSWSTPRLPVCRCGWRHAGPPASGGHRYNWLCACPAPRFWNAGFNGWVLIGCRPSPRCPQRVRPWRIACGTTHAPPRDEALYRSGCGSGSEVRRCMTPAAERRRMTQRAASSTPQTTNGNGTTIASWVTLSAAVPKTSCNHGV